MSGSLKPPLTLRELDTISVQRIRGVGTRRADALASIGIKTVFDLLTHYPKRHVDRTREVPIANLTLGEKVTVTGDITSVRSRSFGAGRRKTMVEARLVDDTGVLMVVFFSQPWREEQLSEGMLVALFGKVDSYRNKLQMTNPLVDLLRANTSQHNRTGVIVPIYPQSPKAKLMTWEMAEWIGEALVRCEARDIADPLPDDVRSRLNLLDRHTALRQFHNPDTAAQIQPARRRLVFDELMRVQMMLRRDRLRREEKELGIAHGLGPGGQPGASGDAQPDTNGDADLWHRFTTSLPFELTAAQRRTISEIEIDMARSRPMHRLLQGDVGSGKTLVAARVLLAAVANRHQGVLMVPTEVLAEQHHLTLSALLDGLEVVDTAAESTLTGLRPVRVDLLVGSMSAKAHQSAKARLADGRIDIVVGTHALIQEAVKFCSLSAVVIDEQHRFGVEQRSRLREFGRSDDRMPHTLVMTATPIPRTAAMTVYGDLDVSVLDEMPPGRTPVETMQVRGGFDMEIMWAQVREQVEQGQQAYVVCPLIEESEAIEARSAETTYNELCESDLAGLSVELLHGRMRSAVKEKIMDGFRIGKVSVLVATTVVEVGVDVPNATVMVILSADRFGMAQLHQLRGRVGRGTHASCCYLVRGEEIGDTAEQRLAALVETTDGFKLAEEDLKLRGEGTLFDEAQSGRSDLKLASLLRDRELVQVARAEAERLQGSSTDLSTLPSLAGFDDEIDWFVKQRDGRDAVFLQRG